MRRWLAPIILLALATCGPKPAPRGPGGIAGLLAYVPADTPYLVASLEPWTVDDYLQWKQMYAPLWSESVQSSDKPGTRFLRALATELGSDLTEQHLAERGFSAHPHLVIYGIGTRFVVMRAEIVDGDKARATVERAAESSGMTLERRRVAGHAMFRAKAGAFVFEDNQLVMVFGEPADLDRDLAAVMARPARAFDERVLRDAIAQHHLDPHFAGMLDSAQLLRAAAEHAGLHPTGACAHDLDALAARAPRVVGSMSVQRHRQSMKIVAEVAPALRDELAATKVALPGTAAAFATLRVLTFAIGADLVRGQRILTGVAENIQRAAATCGWSKLREIGDRMTQTLGTPLPPWLAQLRGAVGSLVAYTPARFGPLPDRIEGFVVLYGALPQELVTVAQQAGVTADGQLHPVQLGALGMGSLPYRILGAISEQMAAVAIGDRGEQLATRALAARDMAPAPLVRFGFDYAGFAQMVERSRSGRSEADKRAVEIATNIYGAALCTLDVTDEGLVAEMGWDIK